MLPQGNLFVARPRRVDLLEDLTVRKQQQISIQVETRCLVEEVVQLLSEIHRKLGGMDRGPKIDQHSGRKLEHFAHAPDLNVLFCYVVLIQTNTVNPKPLVGEPTMLVSVLYHRQR